MNLSPLPWSIDLTPEESLVSGYSLLTYNDKLMCIQARIFLDIAMKRGWGVVRFDSGWAVAFPSLDVPEALRAMRWPDPFTAITETEKWWKENHDNNGK